MGEPRWLPVAANLLIRAGLEAEPVQANERLGLLRWALGGRSRQFDAVHHLTGPSNWKSPLLFRLRGLPVVWHWIGSDVLAYRESARRRLGGAINRRAALQWAGAHLADSPELAEELRTEGIASRVVRLLPEKIEAGVLPLPPACTVLSYWSDSRRTFYGGDTVLQLAREFPELSFHIVGATGKDVNAPPNVRFFGGVADMDPIYRDSTVLIRMPRHDSLSAMVLEVLARGRYVIYNRPLEACHLACDLDEARRALREIIGRREPNAVGAEMVRSRFSLDVEARSLAEVYSSLHGARGHSARVGTASTAGKA